MLRISSRLLPGVVSAFFAAWIGLGAAALAADDEARALYMSTCSKCHGGIAEDAISRRNAELLHYVVTMPLGPRLTGVFGRQAGIIDNYPYSRGFKAMIENPWVWNEETLDLWLTSSQAFIRGSTMFLKVPDPDDREKIIGYLKKYAQYKG